MKKHKDLVEDIKQSEYLLDKIKQSEIYSQNLYAAFCNVSWQHKDIWPILKDDTWAVSWRTAGSIIAELRDCGENYLDWYLSNSFQDNNTGTIVSEGTVTDEIKEDLAQLGWFVHTLHNK